MPVIDNDPIFAACDELPNVEGTPFDIGRARSYKLEHLVRVKVKFLGPIDVCLCPGLPLPGSFFRYVSSEGTFEYDRLSILTNQSARRRYPDDPGSWEWWVVTSVYNTFVGGLPVTFDRGNNDENPEQDLADVDWDFETIQKAEPFDLDDIPFFNMAHMPHSPPFVQEVDYPVLMISRNERNFDYNKAASYARTLNDSSFLGAPRGCVQVYPPKGKRTSNGKIIYWRTSYKFRFRPPNKLGGYTRTYRGGLIYFGPDPASPDITVRLTIPAATVIDDWQPSILNQGFFYLANQQNTPNNEKLWNTPQPIFKNGHPISHPVMLDQFGQEIKADPLTGVINPWYIKHNVYRYRNFNNLLVNGVS